MNDERYIERDRLRFIKNSLPANLAIVGILFNVFYFVNIYQSDVGTYYYTITIGASNIYNLLFLLFVFLASEAVKNYQKNYTYFLIAAGAMQFVRITQIPMQARAATTLVNGVETSVMSNGQFMWASGFLAVSGVALIAAAVINFIKCSQLEEHLKTIENQ